MFRGSGAPSARHSNARPEIAKYRLIAFVKLFSNYLKARPASRTKPSLNVCHCIMCPHRRRRRIRPRVTCLEIIGLS